jgi:hypothetical protein
MAFCYHPQNLVYPVKVLISQLSGSIDTTISKQRDAAINAACNFNPLKSDLHDNNFGLYQLVKTQTRRYRVLDKVFVSRPDIYDINDVVVFPSLVETKHMAILVKLSIGTCTAEQHVKRKE